MIEPTGESKGHCDCCGSTTKRVWGWIHGGDGTVGAYFVGWAEQRPEHGAAIDLILGQWGDDATQRDRFSVALDYRTVEGQPQFMVVDAQGRLPSADDLAGAALKRGEVVGTPLAPQVFSLVDAIYSNDLRLTEIRNWGR